ncbi:MAG: S49 family peptidase [Alphaproteobacteria bacterium]|nr:S49 family peptidase [Alphaproteobacteria bacterium]
MLEPIKARLRWPPFGKRGPVVPVLRFAGVIGAGGGGFRGEGLSLQSLSSSIERAFKMRGAKAVALAINSPGGSPVQSALITERIRTLASEHELPVIAFVEDVGASGGYWLALAADEIFADPNSIIGSIGVISAGFGFVETMEKLGVERRVYTAGAFKSLLDPFRPEDPDGVARLKVILEEAHKNFKEMVRTRRGERLQGEDADLFEGQVWTGKQALESGLIDGLGHMHGVLKERFGEDLKLPLVTRPRPWWMRRLGRSAAGGGIFSPKDWIDGALDSLEARALWARFGL